MDSWQILAILHHHDQVDVTIASGNAKCLCLHYAVRLGRPSGMMRQVNRRDGRKLKSREL